MVNSFYNFRRGGCIVNKLVLVSLVAALLVAGCLGGGQPQATPTPTAVVTATATATATATIQQQGPIKIGFLGPLTGDVANLGTAAKNGMQLAVDEINANGGINGQQIQAVYEDGKCNPEMATNAVNKLTGVDKVTAIIGGLCSGETLAGAPIVEKSKTVILSYCSSNPAITTAGDYVFRDYMSDSYQGKVGAEYMYNTLHLKKVATLSSQDAYAIGIRDVFKARFIELGGQVVADEVFEHNANDVRTQLTKIKAANPDGIYFPAYTQGYSVGLKQANELGLKVPIVGGDAADDPAIPTAAGAGAEGFVYTTPKSSDSDVAKAFNSAYKAKFSADPLLCAPQAYDAVKIIASVMKTSGNDATKLKDGLYSVEGYGGASGTIGFDANGDLKNPAVEFKTFKNGKIAVVNMSG